MGLQKQQYAAKDMWLSGGTPALFRVAWCFSTASEASGLHLNCCMRDACHVNHHHHDHDCYPQCPASKPSRAHLCSPAGGEGAQQALYACLGSQRKVCRCHRHSVGRCGVPRRRGCCCCCCGCCCSSAATCADSMLQVRRRVGLWCSWRIVSSCSMMRAAAHTAAAITWTHDELHQHQ